MNGRDWHPFEYRLTLHLGEVGLATFRLPVLRRVYRLGEIRAMSAPPALPALPEHCAGYLLADIPLPCDAPETAPGADLIRCCVKSYARSFIDMRGDFDAYQAKFSGKTRSGIRRKIRKFAERAGGLDLRSYRTPVEIETFFEQARPVSAASYQERLLDCGLPDDREYVAAAMRAAAADRVRAFLLFDRERPVSYLYCPVSDGVLEYAYLGYVPEYAKWSPGTVLQWLAIEQLFAEQRFVAFDFTEGDSEHKRFFSTDQVPCSLQLLLRNTLRNRAAIGLHRFFVAGNRRVTNGLERLGVKRSIKRFVRRVA